MIRVFCGMLVFALFFSDIGMIRAEETPLKGQVELFSEGGFPKSTVSFVKTRSANSIEDVLLRQLKALAEEIDVSQYRLSVSEFSYIYGKLLNFYPELFYVSGGFSYYISGSYVTSILPSSIYSGSELERMQNIFESGVSRVVSYARAASTDVGRMLRANDYLCANFEYDLSYSIYNPEKFFENGKGVCQAYMLAFRAVLNRLGITNITVTSNGMNHTWNMVYLDGSWYHIDVTWNDPISDVPLRACHDNFLLSDAGISATGHYGWTDGSEEVVTAGNQKYDAYFWRKITQAMPMQGDVVYYADSDYTTTGRDVYSHNLVAGTSKKLCSYDYGYGSYYVDYNPIWVYDGMLYYAVRDALYRMPMAGGTAEAVYSTGNSSRWIWHPYQSGSKLKMFVSDNPGGRGEVVSCDLKKACTEHTPVFEEGMNATCTEPGFTQKSHCGVCGEVLAPSEEIPPLGHDEGAWIVVTEATTDTEGLMERRCTVCEAVLESEIIPRLEEARVPGDASGDGVVDGRDLIRLAKYLGGYGVEIDAAAASVNGDDVVDGRDLIRLAKFLGGYDVELK